MFRLSSSLSSCAITARKHLEAEALECAAEGDVKPAAV